MLNDTLDYLEEVNPDYELAGLARCRVMANLAHYEQMVSEKRRASMQSTLDSWFKKKKPSHPEASATDEPITSEEPHTNEEPYTSDEPQPGTSTDGYTRPKVSSPLQLPSLSLSLSDLDNPDVI